MKQEIKNLKRAAERIKKAIKNKERVILYGDTDLDGITSVIILEESIKNLGGKISAVYFPDREKEGYGITETALAFLKSQSPALLIAVDCGIGNIKEVKIAKKIGFKVIIIDHHQVIDELPKADIIVDPQQKSDKYPFKGLAAVGVVFKLSEVLLKNKMTDNLKNTFLELTALATLADMMPKEEENKIFIEQGLFSLENSWRPGIKAFLETEDFKDYFDLNQKVSKIISILNIRDVENGLPAGYRLLTTPSIETAKKMIKELLIKNRIRKERIEEITKEIEKKIEKEQDSIIFEGDSAYEIPLVSTVASIICKRYSKPVFLFKKLKEESQGTVRTPAGIDSICLMKKCSKYLLTYGGHAQASGFRIKNENLQKFKE